MRPEAGCYDNTCICGWWAGCHPTKEHTIIGPPQVASQQPLLTSFIHRKKLARAKSGVRKIDFCKIRSFCNFWCIAVSIFGGDPVQPLVGRVPAGRGEPKVSQRPFSRSKETFLSLHRKFFKTPLEHPPGLTKIFPSLVLCPRTLMPQMEWGGTGFPELFPCPPRTAQRGSFAIYECLQKVDNFSFLPKFFLKTSS